MSSVTLPVSERLWADNRETILQLLSSKTKVEVVQILNEQYGFNVTLSQLEAKLVSWQYRKNLSRDEWRVILGEIDGIDPSGTRSKVTICGKLIAPSRVTRARKHCKSLGGRAKKHSSRLDLSQVQIHLQAENGQWHIHKQFSRRTASNHANEQFPFSIPLGDTPVAASLDTEHVGAQQSTTSHDDVYIEQDEEQYPFDIDALVTDYNLGMEAAVDSSFDLSLGMQDVGNDFIMDSRQSSNLLVQNSDPLHLRKHIYSLNPRIIFGTPFQETEASGSSMDHMPDTMQSPFQDCLAQASRLHRSGAREPLASTQQGYPSSRHNASSKLGNLGFQRFETDLDIRGIHVKLPWLITASPRPIQAHQMRASSSFTFDITRHSPDISIRQEIGFNALQWYSTSLLRKRLGVSAGPSYVDKTSSLISEDDTFYTNFNRTLLSGLANGCAGLHNIPIGKVLRHLVRYRHTTSLLLQFLQQSQSFVARALAENLFRASIEACNVTALKAILEIRSIDVSRITYAVYKRTCAPIGRAAYLGSLEIVRTLRRAAENGPELRDTGGDGPLLYLLRRLDEMEGNQEGHQCPEEVVDIIHELLRAGYRSTKDVLSHPFIRIMGSATGEYQPGFDANAHGRAIAHVRANAAYILGKAYVTQHSHSEFVSKVLLNRVAQVLDDDQASELIKFTVQVCQQEHGHDCLAEQPNRIEAGLIMAARTGKLQLMQVLIPYVKRTDRVLSAAIRSDIPEAIDIVLKLEPDLTASAHGIDVDSSGREVGNSGDFVTSLSEAIRAGNDELISRIINAGYFDKLTEGGRFETALAAAAETGDFSMVQSLLNYHRYPRSSEFIHAISRACTNHHEVLAMLLLNAGGESDIEMLSSNGALSNETTTGNHALISAIVGASGIESLRRGCPENCTLIFRPETRQDSTVFEIAVMSGDVSIVSDLLMAYPRVLLGDNELLQALARDDQAMFNFLIASNRLCRKAITRCLEYAMSIENKELLENLVTMGADPRGNEILEMAALDYPQMLDCVLKSYFIPSKFKHPGAGGSTIIAALEQNSINKQLLKQLQDSEVADVWNMPSTNICDEVSPYYFFTPVSRMIQRLFSDGKEDLDMARRFFGTNYEPNRVIVGSWDRDCISGSYVFQNQTILLLAIEMRSLPLSKMLVEDGADVNKPACLRIRRTPLQKACEVGNLEIVDFLLDNRADPNGKPAMCHGATALQLAAIYGDPVIAAVLIDHGADLNQPPPLADGRWPLEGAAENGRIEMIEYLGRIGFPAKAVCERAMDLAEKRGHLACRDLIKDIMSNGISVPPSFDQTQEDMACWIDSATQVMRGP
ncbi:putative Ankyrin [Seiridium unicorne]|uniref:Ankyrin n=1 Tax=Seiridium unicorne TaxID=138068 RepID=A0ABR2UFN9_9PEZI